MSYLCRKLEQMKRLIILFCALMMAFNANCDTKSKAGVSPASKDNNNVEDSISQVLSRYLQALDTLVLERDTQSAATSSVTPNAYYFQLLSPLTLYSSPLHQMMSGGDASVSDPQLQRLFSTRKTLSSLYTNKPQLVVQTENDFGGQVLIPTKAGEVVPTAEKLADKVATAVLTPEVGGPVEVVTRRPNFWKFSGSSSLQFSQNYFSDNWYKGGESNYAGNAALTLRANYNDQRKISWENTLDAQLGFQTSETDEQRVFRPTSNLLRYTTNAGYKAWKNLYYSLQVLLQTQIAPNYKKNKKDITSKFLSPLEVTVAPGMKYEIAWGKKKRFTGTLNVAPLAMKILYVNDDDLTKNYGLEEDKHQKTTFGPNVTLNTRWQVCKQIAWTSRIYWMSNFEYNIWEWENTIEFNVTKLITTRVYLYPRFDNSNEKYRSGENHDGTYMMFKEWVSLGLTYNF